MSEKVSPDYASSGSLELMPKFAMIRRRAKKSPESCHSSNTLPPKDRQALRYTELARGAFQDREIKSITKT